MSDRDEEELRAEAWLHAQGYITSRPSWLPRGRNPDFWAESATGAPPHFWVEVKSIDPDDSTAAMRRFSNLMSAARIPPSLHGHAMMEFEPHAIEQSFRWVLKSFAKRAAAYAGRKVSLMFLQQTRDCTKDYQVEIDAETPMVVWARADDLPLNPATAVRADTLYATAGCARPTGAKSLDRPISSSSLCIEWSAHSCFGSTRRPEH